MTMINDYSYVDDKALKLYNKRERFVKIQYGDVISLDFDIYIHGIDSYDIGISSNISDFSTGYFSNFKNKKEIRKLFWKSIDESIPLSIEIRNKRWKQQTEQVIDSLQKSVEVVFQKIFLKACGL